jgi:tol-pal system protein YbgF
MLHTLQLFRRIGVIALVASSGCATAQRSVSDLEAQVRTLSQERDRQARRIEQLETRLTFAEDTARNATRAAATLERNTVHITDDGSARGLLGSAEVEPIPTALHEDNGDEEPSQDEPNRPIVRAAGRAGPPPISSTPIVVREEDRLPVVPLPPTQNPANTPANSAPARGPQMNAIDPANALPSSQPLVGPSLVAGGVSSARDPLALTAYESALAHARSGGCAQAVAEFGTFLSRWPDHPMADNAMYWRGECALEGGDVRQAAQQFASVVQRFPYGHKVADSIFKLAMCYRRLGDEPRARMWSDRLQREFPTSELNARLRAEASR